MVTTYGYTNGWCSTETITDSQSQYSYVYTYNSNGNVLTVVINGQNYATYTYNDDNQLTNLLYGNGDSVQYSYDENGNCIAQYKNNDTTPFVTMTYAQDDEENYYVSSKTYDDTKQRVEYNSNGEIEKIYRISGDTETLIVDNTGDSQQIGGYKVITEEDDDSITYTSSSSANSIEKILRYSYSSDDNSNSYSVTHQASNYTTIHNVLSATETYSNDGDLTQIEYIYDNGESSIDYTAQYDDEGRVTYTTRGNSSYDYYYDEDGRLEREDETAEVFTNIYEYDERGNLYTKKQYDYSTGEVDESTFVDIGGEYAYTDDLWIDCLDKMVSTKDDSFMEISYDVNGNPVEYKYGDLIMTQYQWDGRNLTSISTLNDGTGETAEIAKFTYDENGMRTSKTYEGVTTYYVYDGGTLLSQYDMDDTGTVSNVMFFLYDECDEISGVNYNGSFYYYQKDILGSVVGAYDYTGKSTHSANYDAWGHNYLSSVSNSSFQSVNPIGYRGYYYDKGISMFYLQSRYYDPGFGRFLNADDPMMLQYTKNTQDGLNLFAYCNNDPINYVDPTGHFSIPNWLLAGAIDIVITVFIPGASAILISAKSTFKTFFKKSFSKKLKYKISDYIEDELLPKLISKQKTPLKKALSLSVSELYDNLKSSFLQKINKSLQQKLNNILNMSKTKIGKRISNFVNAFITAASDLSILLDIVSSYGSFIAFFLDLMPDLKYDERVTLW